ncbi:glycoprotein-N-acetylgalactosamine 3-beta-galactosyltransferase 1-like [Mercenaria mercenaria]|uniref:glycoprotein-N-acetylgalactosamine 3-beta-galactosyltransferase 1-like n=1 Tax=Mercenaria mercenaria TaxID=6596 RepID=UPI00234F35E1|nr:glycoprotein-N-acetylgalactosamine 3-beta-galactosyltransferase 1-like [Mercenaria mercenaria]
MRRCRKIVLGILSGLVFIWSAIFFKSDHISEKSKHRYKPPTILCWIMTSPENLYKKAVHVKNTWARRCNKSIFFSSEKNESFPVVSLNVAEGKEHLTGKTMQAFRYVFENHLDEADWYLKADDDTYVIFENLQYFLSKHIATYPIMFGHYFAFEKRKYFHGGSGYVISKEALRIFGNFGDDPRLCKKDGPSEDIHFARCMKNLGVTFGNSSDERGRSRFHAFTPERHIAGQYPNNYYNLDALGANHGIESISDYPVSFHKVYPQQMYMLEFYAYHFQPYGLYNNGHDFTSDISKRV